MNEFTETTIPAFEMMAPQLVNILEACKEEPEVQLQIVKSLSIVSEKPNCTSMLVEYVVKLGSLLQPSELFTKHSKKNLGFISRIGYILGNIMSQHDYARMNFYNNDIAMSNLLQTLEFYADGKLNIKSVLVGHTVSDVLIKLVRVIANISVNGEIGYKLGNRAPLGVILLQILIQSKNSKVNHCIPSVDMKNVDVKYDQNLLNKTVQSINFK